MPLGVDLSGFGLTAGGRRARAAQRPAPLRIDIQTTAPLVYTSSCNTTQVHVLRQERHLESSCILRKRFHKWTRPPPPLYELCTTFPTSPTREIPRDQYLDTFERVTAGSVDLLVLEGDGGIGKTTLLSQFARRHPRTAVSSFVTPMPRYGYDPTTLRRDYVSQLLSVLYPKKTFPHRDERDGMLQTLIQKLKRRHTNRGIYFILDGITDISDPIMRQEVARFLPIGQGFPVIISGEEKLLPAELRDNTRVRAMQAVNFSLTDVQQYLAGLDLSDSSVRTVYLECGKGIPAHVAAVRRCLVAGIDVDRMRGRGIRDPL